ncbi:MAG: oligosaccharide flippase family protein [Candidatus Peribacteraceae bacterium]
MRRPSLARYAPALTALGQRFRFDAHYYAKNSGFVVVGHVVGFLRGIVTGYLVARLFDQSIYGEYQFMLSIVGMISVLNLSGMPHSVTRAWARGDRFSMRRITLTQFYISAIGSCILFGAIPFLGMYGREELWSLFLVAGILFPLPPIAMVLFGGYTVGLSRFDIALKANFVWSALMMLASLIVVFMHQSSLLMLIVTMSIPSLVYLFFLRRLRPPSDTYETENTRKVVRYAWQLTFATFPSEIVWYIDKLMISHFFGLNQLALFSVAILIPEQAKIFLKQFFPISFAKQAKGGDTMARRRQLFRVVLLGTLLFAVCIALYILAAPWLMPFLFPGYEAKELVLLTSVAAASLITMPSTLLSQYLDAQGLIRHNYRTNWTSAAVFAVLLVWLIPQYGLLGAVLARFGARLTSSVMSWMLLAYHRPTQV